MLGTASVYVDAYHMIEERKMSDDKGLYDKFRVRRTDGLDVEGQKHCGDDYFVLNLTRDPHALVAARAYAMSCRDEKPVLSKELNAKVDNLFSVKSAGTRHFTLDAEAGSVGSEGAPLG
jgi:hypothetical protein